MNSRSRGTFTSARCLLIILAGLAGCGHRRTYDTIPVFPATGELFINGVPAIGAIVQLRPEQPQAGVTYPLMPSGKVDGEGKYRLTTYDGGDGSPPGTYKVVIRWPDPEWRPPGGGMPPPPPDRLKGAFADPKQSKWTVTITEGDNALDVIQLDNVEILEGSKLPQLER